MESRKRRESENVMGNRSSFDEEQEAAPTPQTVVRPLPCSLKSGMQGHEQTVTRPQRQQHLGFDRMPRHQAQAIALRDRGKHQLRFHHRKSIADALARSSSEG